MEFSRKKLRREEPVKKENYSNLARNQPSCVVERLEFMPIPKEAAPYLELKNVSDIGLYNAVGLVGLILVSDEECLRNQISGFNTLFSLFEKRILATKNVLDCFNEYGFEVSPIVINDFNSLWQSIAFTNCDTKTKISDLFGVSILDMPSSAMIRTCIDFSNKLEHLKSLKYSPIYTVAICGSIYSLMLKKIYNKYADWIIKLWMEVSNAGGVHSTENSPNQAMLPSFKAYNNIYAYFSASFQIKRLMFEAIREKANIMNSWGAVCHAICSLAKFSELEHIVFINKFILDPHPDVLMFPSLKGEFTSLLETFRGILNANIETVDIPFLKILRRDELTEKLDVINFPRLWYIADEVGFHKVDFTRWHRGYLDSECSSIARMILARERGNEKEAILPVKSDLQSAIAAVEIVFSSFTPNQLLSTWTVHNVRR